MKKTFIAVIMVLLVSGAPVFADKISEGKESEYYYVNVPVEKVFSYRKGYVVQYRKGLAGKAYVYLPLEWFTEAAGKGDLVTITHGTAWPSLSVYYKAGKFSHVRLTVRREKGHETWGTVSQGLNIDDRFENVEDIKLEF